jgi:Lipocalin-like domain
MRKQMMVAAVVMLPLTAIAAEEKLSGTYKLVSSTRTLVDSGQVETYAKEQGFITYGNDGRMLVLILRGDRPKPESLTTMTDQQRADLFRTLNAYGGTYKFDGKTMEHHIDISANEVWTGTTQIRDVKMEGDRLIYTTRPAPFVGDGKMSVQTLVWEKVK